MPEVQSNSTQRICPLLSGGDHAERLLDYANRKLNVESASLIEQHAASCPACSAFVESQRSVWKALDEWDAAEISSDFDRRLWARIEQEERAPWYVRLWNRATDFGDANWRPVVPVAAVLLLAVGLYVKPFSGSFIGTPTSTADVTVRVDAEQLETALEEMEMLRQFSPTDSQSVHKM
ncbi:MAG: hypothetical protein HY820_24025 [Acidobacteria bacterium]|nr:hypothetical protein [Acidobacteriota bacterium]